MYNVLRYHCHIIKGTQLNKIPHKREVTGSTDRRADECYVCFPFYVCFPLFHYTYLLKSQPVQCDAETRCGQISGRLMCAASILTVVVLVPSRQSTLNFVKPVQYKALRLIVNNSPIKAQQMPDNARNHTALACFSRIVLLHRSLFLSGTCVCVTFNFLVINFFSETSFEVPFFLYLALLFNYPSFLADICRYLYIKVQIAVMAD